MHRRSKEEDFKCLEETSLTLLNNLIADEGIRDLDEQFRNKDVGHHRYFIHPYKRLSNEWGPMFEIQNMIPLPKLVQDDLNKQLHTASFMGIIPEINRVWITIDNKIIFWNYLTPSEVDRYDGLRDVVVSVAISAPKPGVFLDTVKYLIVIATTVEVHIMAVSWTENQDNFKNGVKNNFKIIPTSYTISTDNVPMLAVIGTQNGRIFMGGQDGNLYELQYDNNDSKSFFGLDGLNRVNKCYKINHNSWGMKAILPPFIRSVFLPEESVTDLVADAMRHLVYIITSSNNIRIIFTGTSNQLTTHIVPSFDLSQAIQHFIQSTGRSFDSIPKLDFFQDKDLLAIHKVYPLSPTESKNVQVIVVLRSAVRIYLQLSIFSEARRSYLPYNICPPNQPNISDAKFHILFIRGPPPSASITSCSNLATTSIDGYIPQISKESQTRISSSFYSHGVFLTSLQNKDTLLPDELVGISEDIINRKLAITTQPLPSVSKYNSPESGLREAVCRIDSINSQQVMNYKIFDIKESCPTLHNPHTSTFLGMYLTSATPVASTITDVSKIKYMPISKPSETSSYVPLYYSSLIAPSGRFNTMGVSPTNYESITTLTELTLQTVPNMNHRQFLILTRFGLFVVSKNRPIDYLSRCLLSFDGNLDNSTYNDIIDEFFRSYGHRESIAMCLEISSGLPNNLNISTLGAKDSNIFSSSVIPGTFDMSVLKDRARKVILKYGSKPTYTTLGHNPDTLGRDSRLTAGSLTPTFSYSFTHESILLVVSRILRPIWLKPVTENKTLATIWSPWILTTMRSTTLQFQQFLNDYYPDAVRRDAFASKSQVNTAIHFHDPAGKSTHPSLPSIPTSELLTERIAQNSTIASIDPLKQYEKEANDREFSSINSVWRLLTRSNQALSLLQLLHSLETAHKVKVNWSQLNEMSFRTLVVSSSAHDRLKRLLHELIANLTSSTDHRLNLVVNDFTQKLTEDCYLYFSAGDRYAYEVSKQIESIRAEQNSADSLSARKPSVSPSQMNGLLYLLIKASQYWDSIDDVKDDGGKLSLLSMYCQLLFQLGTNGQLGIVELCLSAARNFETKKSISASPAASIADFATPEWDRFLYHSGYTLSETQRNAAKESCYHCLIKYIKTILQLKKSSQESIPIDHSEVSSHIMVVAILEKSADTQLRTMLFGVLLEDDIDELLAIRSADVESYLMQADLQFKFENLYRYYVYHGMYEQAANHVYTLAHSDDDLNIETRLKYLKQAYESTACLSELPPFVSDTSKVIALIENSVEENRNTSGNSINGTVNTAAYSDFLREVQDEIVIAELQLEALVSLRGLKTELSSAHSSATNDGPGGRFEKLQTLLRDLEAAAKHTEFRLLPISILFNEITLPFGLWTQALCLLQHSGLDAPDAVRKLWRSILYRRIPLEAGTTEGRVFLQQQRTGDSIFFDEIHQCHGPLFEDTGEWLQDVENSVISTGNKLYTHADIPTTGSADQLLEELEELAVQLTICNQPVGRGWAARLLLKLTYFSYGVITDLYMRLAENWHGASMEKSIHLVTSIAFILSQWVSAVSERNRALEKERLELVQAMRSGALYEWLSKLDRQINLARAHMGRVTRTSEIRLGEAVELVGRVRKMIGEL